MATWTWRQRLTWVRAQTEHEYAPQPYLQLAEVYGQDGKDKERRSVLIAKQDDLRRYGVLRPAKLWNLTVRALTGYGHEAWRAAICIVLCLLVIAIGLIWQVKTHDGFVPVGTTADQVISPRNHFVLPSSTCTNYYPCISVAIYPIDARISRVEPPPGGLLGVQAHTRAGDSMADCSSRSSPCSAGSSPRSWSRSRRPDPERIVPDLLPSRLLDRLSALRIGSCENAALGHVTISLRSGRWGCRTTPSEPVSCRADARSPCCRACTHWAESPPPARYASPRRNQPPFVLPAFRTSIPTPRLSRGVDRLLLDPFGGRSKMNRNL